MASAVSIFHAICFMLVQIIDINVAIDESSLRYDNTTNYTSELNTGRSKRSLYGNMPAQLKIRVKYETGDEIDLNWVKKPNYLANEHLPVRSSSGHLNRYVMNKVGEFVLYEDLETCSSVAFFAETQTFIGHFGLNYIIDELPFKFDANGNYPGVVGAPYVMRKPKILPLVQPIGIHSPLSVSDIRVDFIHSLNVHSNWYDKRPSETDPGPSTKHQRTERDLRDGNNGDMINANVSKIGNIRKRRWNPLHQVYYLETLVTITADVADIFKEFYTADDYMTWIVKYCIRYFNAADTLFDKISGHLRMKINIAKIVILDNSNLLDSTITGEIRFTETVAKLRKYLHERQSRYPPDSFDHVVMITSNRIMHNSVRVPGITDYSADLYEKRYADLFYDAVPITAVDFTSSYVQAVHWISRTLNMNMEPSVAVMESTGQCDNIMQEGSSMCYHCLKWSDDSEQQFKDFFRENHNRCFLLNEPRSMRPPGPSRFLTPSKQCQCFGYKSFIPDHRGRMSQNVKVHECSVSLQCMKVVDNKSSIGYILPPFDGTKCGSDRKVCWNRQCVALKPALA